MPPPLPVEESDVESAAEEIPSTKADLAENNDEPADATMKDKEDEEDEDDEEDPETFVVEAIKDHRSDFEDGHMRYHVKWKGYEKKSDRTWETEDNLEGAKEILEEYWKSIGGKPILDQTKSSTKKRGRQSTGGKKPDTAKRPKMTKSRTSSGKGKISKSNGATDIEQDGSPVPLAGYTDEGDDDWKAPPAKDGAWDPLVQAVDTVTRENFDGELWGYLIWNIKNEDGRFYRSKAKLPVIYRACPQRMLHFYEKHLVFSTNVPDTATDAVANDEAAAE